MPNIYDMREDEIELAERLQRDRRLAIVGGIVAVPAALVMFAAFVIFCAVM
jgi:hypothetical protein